MDPRAFSQIADAASKAWYHILDTLTLMGSFTTIWQGGNEPYISFIERLPTAILRLVNNVDDQNVLTVQLAYKNVNQDC